MHCASTVPTYSLLQQQQMSGAPVDVPHPPSEPVCFSFCLTIIGGDTTATLLSGRQSQSYGDHHIRLRPRSKPLIFFASFLDAKRRKRNSMLVSLTSSLLTADEANFKRGRRREHNARLRMAYGRRLATLSIIWAITMLGFSLQPQVPLALRCIEVDARSCYI